ncbi:DUF4936 family protein [Massilia sp. H6]|uniref:DUF4936 family protein n=1 Tax=Massilia sp. H6 TaxID=2970464 RepID=UPI0021683797|nr:DUF4936 family protein [Massilia sp. H6]UVW27096.1 DUF4936 family protein [Massilia sp. H6]
MIDLYVYYKVRTEDGAALAARVRAMQAQLAHGGTAAQLKCRPDARDGLQTWMEVYPGAADGFDSVVSAAACAAGLDAYTQGPRRSEIFMDLPPMDLPPCA